MLSNCSLPRCLHFVQRATRFGPSCQRDQLSPEPLGALFATGVYTDVIFGEDPDGNPGPFVTVVGDFDQPASKFSWDGESYESFFEPDLGVTVFVPAFEADHAGLLHCHNLQP